MPVACRAEHVGWLGDPSETRVEECVHGQSASGFSTTLEVTGWPAGTYILHIQTPLGISTKRLVVAR